MKTVKLISLVTEDIWYKSNWQDLLSVNEKYLFCKCVKLSRTSPLPDTQWSLGDILSHQLDAPSVKATIANRNLRFPGYTILLWKIWSFIFRNSSLCKRKAASMCFSFITENFKLCTNLLSAENSMRTLHKICGQKCRQTTYINIKMWFGKVSSSQLHT